MTKNAKIAGKSAMDEKKKNLMKRAQDRHCNIFPCGKNKDLHDCFTTYGDLLLFWLNTEDETTHLMSEKIEEAING